MTDEAQCPTTTRYRPTDYQPGESLAAPAPTGPYGTALSAFDFTEPNGEWRLYAEDDLLGAAGSSCSASSSRSTPDPRPPSASTPQRSTWVRAKPAS